MRDNGGPRKIARFQDSICHYHEVSRSRGFCPSWTQQGLNQIAMAEVELNSRLRLLTVDLKGEIMSVRVLGEPREDSKT